MLEVSFKCGFESEAVVRMAEGLPPNDQQNKLLWRTVYAEKLRGGSSRQDDRVTRVPLEDTCMQRSFEGEAIVRVTERPGFQSHSSTLWERFSVVFLSPLGKCGESNIPQTRAETCSFESEAIVRLAVLEAVVNVNLIGKWYMQLFRWLLGR